MKPNNISSLDVARAPRSGNGSNLEAALALFASDLVACAVLRNGRIVHATPALRKLLCIPARRKVRLLDCIAIEGRPRVQAALNEPQPRGIVLINCLCLGPRGQAFPAEIRLTVSTLGGESVLLLALTDISERVATENRLRAAAHYDVLTGLPNRILLQDRLENAFALASRSARLMALIVADLDGFKAVNDEHGHAAGDIVLREVARRFTGCVRNADTLARLGGDEFVIVMPEVVRREDAALLAVRLVNSTRAPFAIDGVEVTVGTSIGIAVFPDDGSSIDTLFARADAAMYQSKHAGKNRFTYADASTETFMAHQSSLWSDEWRFGVGEMDDDHEELFAMLDHLETTLRARLDRDCVRAELEALVRFSERHFADEEAIMEKIGFRGLVTHRAEHRRLLADVAELAGHTHRVGAALTIRFLRDWLIGHMQTYDRAAAKAICAARAH